MNFVKKILLVHGDATSRRTLTLLLAGAGYDVRPCGQPAVALEAARSEWFDLSLVADPLPELSSFDFIEELKKLQPSVAVLLLVNQLELPSVIKGIRLAVTDVLAPGGDWKLVIQRINALLRPGETTAPVELNPEELAEVEAILSRMEQGSNPPLPLAPDAAVPTGDLREELVWLTRERDDFKKTAERLAEEKTALEVGLKAQLARHDDAVRQEEELTELRSEREVVAAAQAAVDEKARSIAAARQELARERAELAAERAQSLPADEAQRLESADALAREREVLEDLRLDVHAEDVRLREEAVKVRQAQARVDTDRRQLQEDLDLLREQETNLRAYEQRLRSMSAEVEANRVLSAAPYLSRDPFQRDATLEIAWTRLDRAMDMLEAERRNFTGERLALKDDLARLEEKEEALQQREKTLGYQEALLAGRTLQAPSSRRSSLTQTPLQAAKAIFTSSKK
jgi:DNA-binding response OmpR family regulator